MYVYKEITWFGTFCTHISDSKNWLIVFVFVFTCPYYIRMHLPKFLFVHLRMKLCSGYNISYEVDFYSSEIRLILHVSLYTKTLYMNISYKGLKNMKQLNLKLKYQSNNAFLSRPCEISFDVFCILFEFMTHLVNKSFDVNKELKILKIMYANLTRSLVIPWKKI